MNDQTTNVRRYFGAGEQSRGMSADGGAIVFELGGADGGVRIEGQLMGGTQYGAVFLVGLEVVGVPVRRVLAIDDELSWMWERERRLGEVRARLADERQWGEYNLMCARLRKVAALSENLWRRWTERRGAAGICKALVVWGSHGGRGGHGGGVRNVLGKGGVA